MLEFCLGSYQKRAIEKEREFRKSKMIQVKATQKIENHLG